MLYLYRYAFYSRKHNRFHISLLLTLFCLFWVHIGFLLETENIWLLAGVLIYLPVMTLWWQVSSMRDQIPD